MKFYHLGAILASMTLSLSNAAHCQEALTDTMTLSLDKCIAIALDQNPTIKVADMEVKRVDYSKKETLGQLFPTIEFGTNYNRTLEKQTMFMMGNSIKVGSDNSWSTGFSASMPLIAPQLWQTLKLNDSQILQNIESARSSRLSLINEVKSAYYALLLAIDSRDVIQESYDNAVFNADVYEKKYSVGAASEYDVLRTQVAVKNTEPELRQADIAIKQAQLQLAVLMGIDAAIAIKPDTKLADYEADMHSDSFAFDRSIDSNTDLRMLDIQTQQLKDALNVEKMSFLPTLALSFGYNWTSMSSGNAFRNFNWSPYSVLGFSLKIPIFSGGQRYNRVKQAGIRVDEMKWQRENLERSVRMQVDLAIDNIEVNVKQIASNAESVAQADKAYNIMERSFEIGAASYLDLRDSQLALTRARLAYYSSIYNYLIANSELEHLLGNADITKYESLNR